MCHLCKTEEVGRKQRTWKKIQYPKSSIRQYLLKINSCKQLIVTALAIYSSLNTALIFYFVPLNHRRIIISLYSRLPTGNLPWRPMHRTPNTVDKTEQERPTSFTAEDTWVVLLGRTESCLSCLFLCGQWQRNKLELSKGLANSFVE